MRVSKTRLRQIIKEEILREQTEGEPVTNEKVTATEFVAAMKGDLTQIMKVVPDGFNDELMNAFRALVAASKYDQAAFKTSVKFVLAKTMNAVEKSESAS